MLSCVYRTYQLTATEPSVKLKSYSELTMKNIFLVDWVAYKAGMQYSVRVSSLATVPYSMKSLTACFQVILCLRNRNLLGCCITVQYSTGKNANFSCSQLFCIDFNMPRTNFSIKTATRKNHECYRTGPDQLYPIVFAPRPNRVLLVLAIFKRVIDEKMIALRLRTSVTSSASPLMSFSFAEKWSPG